ncbi:MarR family winged helix-turn-helix transcriptional regulator [Kineococcus glutinatus]|uniref:HTH marR-type domain-containing protein n=1 Tax=Kineococcus glutinatus TaxID=1070872 RepID=A0ABP9HP85_9ACTN
MPTTAIRPHLHEDCYISPVTPGEVHRGGDPTELNHLLPLQRLLAGMDAQIAEVYAQRGVHGLRPRFSKALIRLHHRGPLTIKDLAQQVGVTHSAMSQTVTAMRRGGLIDSAPGEDARTRTVTLTDAGAALVPFLEAEWRATEEAWAELDAEVPYPLQRVVEDLAAALRERTFAERVSAHIDALLAAGGQERGQR